MFPALFLSTVVAADQVPRQALQYQREFVRNVRAVWGLNAPIATMAAQVHAESGWRADAQSPFAQGLAQFTPETADWIAGVYRRDLGTPQPFNPSWAIRALALYDKRLYDGIRAATACDRWAFTLAGYNGGPGWVDRDRIVATQYGADPLRYWGHVERYNAGRARPYFAENRGYVRRIMWDLQYLYAGSNWGIGVLCLR